MEGDAASIVFLDNQDGRVQPWIEQVLKEKTSRYPGLSAFVAGAADVLRLELASLPTEQQAQLPHFGTLTTFYQQYNERNYHLESIDNSMLCFGQLAHWIRLCEEMPNELPAHPFVIGLDVGSIAASAISTFTSVSSFIPVALEHIRFAFRVGALVNQVANSVSTSSTGIWSTRIADKLQSKVEALIQTKQSESQSLSSSPYVSSVLFSDIVLSGKPENLQKALAAASISESEVQSCNSAGLYHAPHLYSSTDLEVCLEAVSQDVQDLPLTATLLSSSETEKKNCSLKETLEDLLHRFSSTDMLIEDLSAKTECSKFRVMPIGPCSNVEKLSSRLVDEGFEITVFETSYESMMASSAREFAPSGKIAIVGMSGRFPGGQDTEEFWQMLLQGLDMHKEVPSDRFDAQAHYDPSGKGRNKSHTPFGCFIKDAGLFDPRFFNMSPREAMVTDPMQRLAIMTAYEALEMSGYVAGRTASTKLDRIGTFYGQTSDDWREINEAQDIDTYFITGGVRAFGPGRINYFFKFSGPSFSVDTACSSSMAALQIACTALQAKECDTAITGGLNILTNPDIFSGLSKGQFLSKTGNCQTFDDDADGYCRGDGIGTVILKRLEDAIADNDNILATILSTATNHSAEAVSITHPHAGTQEKLYHHILNQAGVDPLDIGYVEMHGTGTQAGDATEMTSVLNVFAPESRQRRSDQPLYLGSVKSNIGHGEAASGVCALIKVLMMLKKNTIPPHCGIKKRINHTFPTDMLARQIHIAKVATPFSGHGKPRTIYISNFSAAGGNSGMLLREADPKPAKASDPRDSHVVAISARALSSLQGNCKNLAEYLESNPDVSLASLGYTTTARRTHHNYKISFNASSIEKLKSSLLAASETTVEPTAAEPYIVFTFTGQGSHYLGLAGDLYRTSAKFRLEIHRADFTATTFGFPSFLALINGDGTDLESMSPTLVQVALCSIQIALCELWASWDIKPQAVIGHSLGEYAALYAAGVLSASDTIYLVGTRARLLEKFCTAGSHAMLAVNANYNALDDIIRKNPLEIACINGTSEVVLSGTDHDINIAKDQVSASGLRCKKLNVPYAFHSTQVDAILPEFQKVTSGLDYKKPRIPLLSPLLGGVVQDALTPDYLCNHARKAVNFVGALKSGKAAGHIKDSSVFLEIGPQPVTLGFVKSVLGSGTSGIGCLNRKDSNWTSMAAAASMLYNNGARINWNQYHKQFEPNLDLLELPKYSFALKNYWIDYVGNWCLYKGSDQPVAAIQEPELSTTSVQNVVKESYTEDTGLLVAESDIHRADLYKAIFGHQVNGTPFCPSSLYGDMAITIASHMYKKLWKETAEDAGYLLNVKDMEVIKPLTAKAGTEQVLRIEAQADKATKSVKFTFSTGQTEHAHCAVDFENKEEQELKWSRAAYMVQDQITAVKTRAETGRAHVLLSGMAYKLFASLVDYEAQYRGMKRVFYDAEKFEATAEVSLCTLEESEKFVCAPYWLDSIGHLAGFCVNATDAASVQDSVFISHGWESLRISAKLDTTKTYQTYVRMLSGGGTIMVGDVYLFDEGKVVGLFGGLRFQRIPRRILDIMLPPADGRKTHVAKTVAEPAPTATIEKTTTIQIGSDMNGQKPLILQQTVSITSQVMDIVAQECGVALAELADSNQFSDLGVDSLMQLAISGRIREDVGLDISSTLFVDCPTILSLKDHLVQYEPVRDSIDDADSSDASTRDSSGPTSESSVSITPMSDAEPLGDDHHEKLKDAVMQLSVTKTVRPARKAQSFILSGSPKTATQNFFMIPDGGGASISYMHIPSLSKETCVFGLNSPFMENPEEYDVGVAGIGALFVEEIQRRQPHGPYNLGGWSAGGVIAFEVTQQLIKLNEEVRNLVLIDSPCPLIIERLPNTLHQWFNSIGLIGDPNNPGSTKVPAWLLPHFAATINALSTYSARKMMYYNTGLPIPKVTAIWCADGICHNPDDPKPDPYPYGHAQWLLEDHDDYDDGGWDALLGKGTVQGRTIPGNHFTMMRGDNVRILGEEIRKALGITA